MTTTNTRKKVLVVDDFFVQQVRDMQGIERFDLANIGKQAAMECKRLRDSGKGNEEVGRFIARNVRELTDDATRKYFCETENLPFYDLSKEYHTAGGNEEVDLLILGNPVCRLSPNDFYYLNNKKWVAARIFNERKALQTIAEVNPDVLLVDIGFYAPVPNDLVAEYVVKHVEKQQQRFGLKPAGRTCEIDFPLEGYRFLEEIFDYGSCSLQASGGITLAHALKEQGRKFSFWTGDIYHGGEGLSYGYTLDLLSEEEIRELIESENRLHAVDHYIRYEEERNFRDEAERERFYQTWESRLPVAHSDNGRVILARKEVFFQNSGFGPHDNEFVPYNISKLDEIIEIASRYQQEHT